MQQGYERGDRRKGRQGEVKGQTPGQAKSAPRKALRRKIKAKSLELEAERLGITVAQLRARKQKEINAFGAGQKTVVVQPTRSYYSYY